MDSAPAYCRGDRDVSAPGGESAHGHHVFLSHVNVGKVSNDVIESHTS